MGELNISGLELDLLCHGFTTNDVEEIVIYVKERHEEEKQD